ncbi:MAG: DUF1549 domain-containing protein [Planctomycetales bacterium]
MRPLCFRIPCAAGALALAFAGLFAADSRAAAAPLRDAIDARIEEAWKRDGVAPAPPATDAEFLRRVFIDLVGTVPTHEEAQQFLDDGDPAKREKLIDKLLADPRFAAQQANVWDLVFIGRDPPGYDARVRPGFQKFLREQFANNVPYDVWAGKILKAEGNTVDEGAPMFLAQFNRNAEDATEAVTRTFLGMQLQCARCHDHPFEDYSQLDFYGMASFYARLQNVSLGKNGQESKITIGELNAGDVLFTGPVQNQKPGQKGEPVKAKFMKGAELAEPELPKDFTEPRNFPANQDPPKPQFSRKDALADWIANSDNPYFAKAVVNRVWGQFLGRGIAHPVDNLSDTNPPSHPELLDALTAGFVAQKFDMRWLVREIVNSKAYQIGSTGEVDRALPRSFERARVRPLSAEELVAALRTATGFDEAMKAAGKDPDKEFGLGGELLKIFGQPQNGVGDFMGGIFEHLYLNNGGELRKLVRGPKGSLHDYVVNSPDPAEAKVDRMFLATLSRRPGDDERAKFVAYLTDTAGGGAPDARAEEAIWALVTSAEFRFNH